MWEKGFEKSKSEDTNVQLYHMRIHLIAIGGSAMHNFALALDHLGHEVSRIAHECQVGRCRHYKYYTSNLIPFEASSMELGQTNPLKRRST